MPFVIFSYHVIYIDLKVLPYLEGEHWVYELLVGGANILEAEGHDIVVLVTMIWQGGWLGSIKRIHSYLGILGVGVHKVQRAVA